MSMDLSLGVAQDVIRTQPTQQEMTGHSRPSDITNTKVRQIVATDGDLEKAKNEESQALPDVSFMSEEEMQEVVTEFAQQAQNISRDLEFTVDDELGETIITVYDSESEKVVRQIPSEEVLALARNLENNSGVIFKSQA